MIPIVVVMVVFQATVGKSISKNGFTRRITPGRFVLQETYPLPNNTFYLAGVTSSSVFLGNYSDPETLWVFKRDLQGVREEILHIPQDRHLAWKVLKTLITDGKAYVAEGITPAILVADTATFDFKQQLSVTEKFDYLIPVENSKFCWRSFDNRGRSWLLRKGNKSYRLQNGPEAIFSVSGLLDFDSFSRTIVYLYNYTNQFICLDTNLIIRNIGHTIDTITHPNLQIEVLNHQSKQMLTAPAIIVNKHAAVDKGKLYIHSLRKADNELFLDFRSRTVVDVYDTQTATYQGSGYLKTPTKEVLDLKVSGNQLYCLTKSVLQVYLITPLP